VKGWIRTAAVSGKSLADGLALAGGEGQFLVLRDARAGLDYIRSTADLREKGLYLELHAYQTQAYLELRDVADFDGRWGRLAAWLDGRGVPSIDEALQELALAPLHAAYRDGRDRDAVREAAALLGAPEPEISDATTEAQVEALVGRHQPALAHGAWIYEWRLDRVMQDADLVAITLDTPGDAKDGRAPADLLRDDRFRRAIGVHEVDGVTWFDKDKFEHTVTFLGLARPAELRRAAERAKYRLDALEKELAEPPKWASTRPVKPRQKAARPAATAKSPTKAAAAAPTPSKSAKSPTK
jgi:hypothetical protein